jgi:hypothetical protein
MTIVGQKLSTKALKAAFDAAVILEIPKVNWNLTSENLGCEKHKSIAINKSQEYISTLVEARKKKLKGEEFQAPKFTFYGTVQKEDTRKTYLVDGVLNFNTLEKAQEAAQEFRASLQENSEEPTFVKIEWHLPTEQSTEIKNLRKLLSTYRKVHSDSIWVELK